jgi:hypothetical protein
LRISRRSLRKGLVVVGCLVGNVEAVGGFVGLVLIALGGALHVLSKAYLEQNRDLTTAGPYRWTRNPFYLANLVIDVGILCVIGQVGVACVYLPLWAYAYHGTIGREEERLRELFAERFEAYASRVPRLFPFRPPLPLSEATGRFDLSNPSLAEGREYARLLGIGLAPAAIWAAEVIRRSQLALFEEAHALDLAGVLAIPALWVLKLGLAEIYRRPNVRLLPPIGVGRGRQLGGLLSPMPLVIALIANAEDAPGVAAVLLATSALILASRPLPFGQRLLFEAGYSVAALAAGVFIGQPWAAIGAIVWSALAALDRWGQSRFEAREGLASRIPWPYLPHIIAGAIGLVAAVGYARIWVQY